MIQIIYSILQKVLYDKQYRQLIYSTGDNQQLSRIKNQFLFEFHFSPSSFMRMCCCNLS